MCDGCAEIDRRIARYEILRAAATDPLAVQFLGLAIEDFLSEKAALHNEDGSTPE